MRFKLEDIEDVFISKETKCTVMMKDGRKLTMLKSNMEQGEVEILAQFFLK